MARVFSDSSWQNVRLADHADLDASTAVTVMCWAYPTSVASLDTQHLVSKWNSYVLRFADHTSVKGWLFTIFDAGSPNHVDQGSVPALDRWYHVTGTYDGSTLKVRVYDAVAKTVNNYTSSLSGDIDTGTELLFIGSYQSATLATRFNGRIGHVRVWKDLALSDAEIDLCRWYQGSYRSEVVHLPLIGASPEPDFSGGGHSGTVAGSSVADHAPVGPWSGFDLGRHGETAVGGAGPVGPLAGFNYRLRRTG